MVGAHVGVEELAALVAVLDLQPHAGAGIAEPVVAVDGCTTEQGGQGRGDVDGPQVLVDHAPGHDARSGRDERRPGLDRRQRPVLPGVAVEAVGGGMEDGEVGGVR